ncbi:hypothetical protein BH09BAC5_BH09BAC5_01740 [soil metagenome]
MKKFLLPALLVLFSTATQLNAQCSTFYDGFESGSFTTPWTMGTGTYTMTVPNTSPAVGTFNLNMASTVGNSFYEGPIATFTPSQPTYMSWWMRTDNTTGPNGYVVIGDANTTSDNGVIFCYFNSGSVLRFYNTTGFNQPISANTWYHVEAYLNWTSRTSDIYLNSVLILPGWAFRSNSATTIDRIYMQSLVAANVDYDDFIIGAPPVTATATQSNVSCFGGNNGSASVTASGGNGIYTYNWAPSGGTAANATGLSAGTYTCTITDGFGCTGTYSLTITEPPVMQSASAAFPTTCSNSSDGNAVVTIMGGTPGYTYNWLPSGGTNSTATGLQGGTYTCDITDANGCMVTETVTITSPSPVVVTTSGDVSICEGGSANLSATASGGTGIITYDWTPGNISTPTATVTPTVTTIYTITATDNNGCSAADNLTVTVNSLPVVDLGTDIIQCGGVVSMDAQNAGSTYLWNSGDVTQTEAISNSGFYFVDVTNAFGCSASDSINITINSNPIVNLGVDTTQCGGTVMLDAQNAGANFLWNDNSISQTLTVTASGTYFVMVTDNNGCFSSDTAMIVINMNPVVTGMASSSVACVDDADINLTGLPIGGAWSGTGVTGAIFDPTVGPGMLQPVYSYTDSNGCSGSYTVTITVNACTGVTELTDENAVSLYPNPNNGNVNLVVNEGAENLLISIFDIQGNLIYQSEDKHVQDGFVKQLDLTGQSNGLYLMKIFTNGHQQVLRMVIQK